MSSIHSFSLSNSGNYFFKATKQSLTLNDFIFFILSIN